MTPLSNHNILFDLSHNEMLNSDENFSNFLDLIRKLGLKTETNENNNTISEKILHNLDFLVIGNPIDEYFSNIEIKNILNFVRRGGRLLLVSEYGSDHLQKTNLNDIAKHFGIYFSKNIIKKDNKINSNCPSILSIQNFSEHKITIQLKELIIGGSCSLILNKNSIGLFRSNDSWIDIYNDMKNQWIKDIDDNKKQIIAACTEYGQGKVFAIGDVDVFSNDSNIGLNVLDNRKFILNIFSWFKEPVKKSEVILWTLNQLGALQNEVKEINGKINNIIETLTIIEQRISSIEKVENLKFKKDFGERHIEKELYEDSVK